MQNRKLKIKNQKTTTQTSPELTKLNLKHFTNSEQIDDITKQRGYKTNDDTFLRLYLNKEIVKKHRLVRTSSPPIFSGRPSKFSLKSRTQQKKIEVEDVSESGQGLLVETSFGKFGKNKPAQSRHLNESQALFV